MAVVKLDEDDRLHLRLAFNFAWDTHTDAAPEDVADALCFIQSQDLGSAFLAFASRLGSATFREIECALWRDRSLVKTYGPRGTLHLLPTHRYRQRLAALRDAYDLPAEPDPLARAIGEALDGRILNRRDLADRVGDRLGDKVGARLRSSWGDGLREAALHGLLCFAKSDARGSVFFARPDQWLTLQKAQPTKHPLRDLCRQYVRAYGPTNPAGFARWLHIGKPRAEALFSEIDSLTEVRIGRTRAWTIDADMQAVNITAPSGVRLLGRYDPYVLNSQPRGLLVPPESRALIVRDAKGRLEGAVGVPLLLVDGQVRGIWKMRMSSQIVQILIDSFVECTGDLEAEIIRRAEGLSRFYGKALDVKFVELVPRS